MLLVFFFKSLKVFIISAPNTLDGLVCIGPGIRATRAPLKPLSGYQKRDNPRHQT